MSLDINYNKTLADSNNPISQSININNINKLNNKRESNDNLTNSNIYNAHNRLFSSNINFDNIQESEESLKAKIQNVGKEIAEEEALIHRLQNQIKTINANNEDYNKKKNSISDSLKESGKGRISLLTFLIVIVIGLLLGGYINK